MKTRGTNRKRLHRSLAEKELGSYESQTHTDSEVSWTKKKKVSKKSKPASRRSSSGSSKPMVLEHESNLEDKECNLFRSVADVKSALKQVVRGVVKRLDKDQERCLTELTNFMVQAAGSTKHLTTDDVMTGDREELEQDLTKSFDLPSLEHPIYMPEKNRPKKKTAKKLCDRLQQFWKRLVEELGESETLETVLDHCVEWLKSLSQSKQAAFRHTSAALSYWIIDALVSLSNKLEKELAGKKKQLESKKNKKTAGRLSKDVDDIEARIADLQELIMNPFRNIFVHRYRDTKAFIRTMSLEAMGHWMTTYPKFFVKNDFLKYMGWCLNDPEPSVRITVLQSIYSLLEAEDNVELMQTFTERFMNRFLEMVEDCDTKVAACAVRTATQFIKYDFLEDEQGAEIPSLLWDANSEISAAAADFVYMDTFAMDEESEENGAGKKEEDLKELIGIFNDNYPNLEIDYSVGSKANAVDMMVHALFDKVEALQDWKLLTKALLSSSTSKKRKGSTTKWENEQLETLAYVLLSAVKCACGIGPEGPSRKKRDEEKFEEKKTELTKALSSAIPNLLSTYQAEKDSVLPLVEIPQYLDLEFFSSSNAQAFKKMLKSLKAIYLKHVDREIFEQVAATFSKLTENTHDLSDDADHFVRELATLFVQSLSELDLDKESPDEDLAEEIKISVYRLLTLIKQNDCTGIVELDYQKLQKNCLVDSDADQELGLALLELDYLRSFWNIANLKDGKGSSAIDKTVNNMYDTVGHVLSKEDSDASLKSKVCGVITPFFILSTAATVPQPSEGLIELYREAVTEILEFVIANENSEDISQLKQISTLATAYPNYDEIAHTMFRYYYSGNKLLDETIKSVAAAIKKSAGSAVLAQAQLGALKKIFNEERKKTKDVATKFVLMHGIHPKRNDFKSFMIDGIDFGLAEGAAFLDTAIMPFAKRSSDTDLREMYKHLFREQKKLNLEDEEELEKIESFRNDILAKITKKAKSRAQMPPPKPKEKKITPSEETDATQSQEDDEEEKKDMEAEEGMDDSLDMDETEDGMEQSDENVSSPKAERKSRSSAKKSKSSTIKPKRRSSRRRK